MDYFITRDGQQYGPYTLADLQRYVASGHIALSDLARSEGMAEALPVSQIIGSIAVPQIASPGLTTAPLAIYPDPPNLHWALLMLFSFFSCGVFGIVWNFIQAAWIKKLDPASKALQYYIIAFCVLFAGIVLSGTAAGVLAHSGRAPSGANALGGIANIVYFVIYILGRFNLKHSLEQHYNSAEPMQLALSGVMTFFFGAVYFQYHFNEINRRKAAARLGGFAA